MELKVALTRHTPHSHSTVIPEPALTPAVSEPELRLVRALEADSH